MTGNAPRFVRLIAGLLGLVTLGWVLTGQAARPAQHGMPLPTDWTHRHVIFSQPATAQQASLLAEDPRFLQQWYRRNQPLLLSTNLLGGLGANLSSGGVPLNTSPVRKMHRDWAEDMGIGAATGAGVYPAKFSFDSSVANCGNATQPDFVVFGTGLAPSASQASIVAYDNLYSGCGGTVPTTYWAYNTGTRVVTSPVFSRDGSQIAFVQDTGTFAQLVLLKWAASTGTVGAPATPTLVGLGGYRACTAPCMTTITIPNGDTTSSVFYFYTGDIAWVGDNLGKLHKFTGIFNGTPAEAGAPWPVQMSLNTTALSNPVFDRISGNVFVGDAGGFVYRVDSTTGAVVATSQLDFGAGIVAGPILDVTAGLVYVFASSDGSLSCSGGTTDCSAVFQFPTSFSSGSTGSEVTVGAAAVFGTSTPNPMYAGGFDNAYYNSLNATGNLYVCGNTGFNPTLYQVPIVAGAFPGSGLGVSLSALVSAANVSTCSSVTDFANPNTSGGPSERIFVSVQDKGINNSCAGAGCIFNFVDTPWKANTPYSVGQEILDSKLHIEVVITAGTSGGTAPSWGNSAGSIRTDGTGALRWLNQGFLTASTLPAWQANHNYVSTATRIRDTNGNVQVVRTTGTSGATQPTWNTTAGGVTADAGGLTWINAGAIGTVAMNVSGGTSAIIIDNVVGSGTLSGASQIYFSTLGDQTCGTSGTGGCAVQASQPALQ